MFVYAHRGASALAPENTLLAIKQASEAGADGIEFDVYQHQNEFILIHDRWVDRTTNGKGTIDSMSFEQVRSLDAGKGEQIPTLSEVLALIGARCQINIEMKGVHDIELLIDYVAKHCRQHKVPSSNILFSSFDHHVLKHLKRYRPDARIGALTAGNPLDYALFAQQLDAEFANIDLTFVNQAFIEDAKQRGLKVGVYTVNHTEDLDKMKSWGVDAVFCNDPGEALAIINGG
ncbi:glycerophosphodiester phosphodiesterase family protein [Aliiglaciecola sp.]|nr:glycerophosphodiester phosphodiesterase family protein [Aliiglaciecola sp.]